MTRSDIPDPEVLVSRTGVKVLDMARDAKMEFTREVFDCQAACSIAYISVNGNKLELHKELNRERFTHQVNSAGNSSVMQGPMECEWSEHYKNLLGF